MTEKKDIITDIKFILVKFDDRGRVHQGFKKAVDSVWEDMKSYLTNQKQNQMVWFTGYSLGGALATLAADLYFYPLLQILFAVALFDLTECVWRKIY
ncbi:MAG: hypothetical protein GY777_03815 [Candidatus Brocadiaceae bacterium]|nr:hypothetical protein [Candidatus Brocadiaceae bacterium]